MQTHTRTRGGGTQAAAHPHQLTASTAVPVVGGIAYGIYAGLLAHSNGSSDAHSVVLGVIAAVVTAALGWALMSRQSRMFTELRALAYGVLFGCTMGFLYSLAGTSTPLRAAGVGAVFGAVMLVVSLYIFRNHGSSPSTR